MTGILEIPITEAFQTGKDYYTCKIHGTNKNGSDTFIYHITSDDGNLPALVVGGYANASKPWGCPFFGSWGSFATYVASATNWNTNKFHWSLYSHVGSENFGSARLVGDAIIAGGSTDEGITHITIEADFPIFVGVPERIGTNPDYVEYRPTNTPDLLTYTNEISNQNNIAHIDQAVNFLNVANTIPTNEVWSVRCMLKKNGSVVSGTNKAYDFRIQPEARIWFVLNNRLNGDASANMILHINQSPWLQKNAYAPDNTYTETSTLDDTYWFGNWQDYDTGDAYTGVCSTNIPIFDSDEKGDAYGRGEIGIDEALNGGDTSFSRSTIGDDLSESDIPTVNLAVSGCGSYIYALSASDLKEIMHDYLYTTDASLQNNIQDGLWLWGNNPADFIIDLYYIPFDITDFYDTVSANLKFGTYQIPDTSYDAIKEANGDRVTLFNTSFEGIYGDWRDFTQFDYDLYLPFVGFVPLDVQKYLNKTVKCEMMFDITTHNLRYYIFADGIITDRIDGSVGINMPIMATDVVNKAKADRQAKLNAVKTGVNTAGSIAGSIGKIATGKVLSGVTEGATSIANGVIDGIKVYDQLASKPTESIEGAFSSSMNIYDITYAYLRITERALVMPANLNALYGYPSYYMGKASALSGYCEINDIRLVGFTGTKEEAEALKSDLRQGVIL